MRILYFIFTKFSFNVFLLIIYSPESRFDENCGNAEVVSYAENDCESRMGAEEVEDEH